MKKSPINCPHCKYKFVSLQFSGVQSIYCPYCRLGINP
ncbi:zf-TFIIB domain-containing protein [Candidatus Woesearchaeota archaeon]|nr:zf-TFIIB domain-containing protein [Candidatus Woesearchaeota archaeon]